MMKNVLESQREFFNTGITLDINFRLSMLKKLQETISCHADDLSNALSDDLGKSKFESYETEIGLLINEISETLKKLKKWAKPESVHTSILHFPSSTKIIKEPLGVSLIISPWNYPLLLAISPLIASISAGNCSVIKLSEFSVHTSALIEKIISENFPPAYIKVINGDAKAASELLDLKFDIIFFTGSTNVGKIVMQKAAEHLTPVVLELGGKSPVLIDKTANIKLAADRIIWGKFINSGQTCIAPDYVLIDKSKYDEFIKAAKNAIKRFYGADVIANSEYSKIISKKHYDGLLSLLDGQNIIAGGSRNDELRKIEPTFVLNPNENDKIMTEEIFGPILPILLFDNIDNAVKIIKKREKPLALYLFSNDKKVQNFIINSVSFGGGCINDTIIHLFGSNAPFGGVGGSGIGSYHGRFGFDSFSHKKTVLKKNSHIDIKFRYPPFKNKENLLKNILK